VPDRHPRVVEQGPHHYGRPGFHHVQDPRQHLAAEAAADRLGDIDEQPSGRLVQHRRPGSAVGKRPPD
jgi:hypothetical protein